MIRYEKASLQTRIELLTKIESFLNVCGWQTHRKSNEILYATDSLGGGLVFNFIPYKGDYNRVRSSINVCNSINNDLNYNQQPGFMEMSMFDFQKNAQAELNQVYLIGDDKNFTILIDNSTSPIQYNLFFTCGWLRKTHDFNGGRTAFTNMCFNGSTNWSGITTIYKKQHAFSYNTGNSNSGKLAFFLGDIWRHVFNVDLRSSKFLTNLMPINTNSSETTYNQLSALSAVPLLQICKSTLSGLYTLITPNFFYKNNRNIFVHAGDFDMVRVLGIKSEIKPGQILHLGDEKFILFNTYTFSTSESFPYYIVAVKIA